MNLKSKLSNSSLAIIFILSISCQNQDDLNELVSIPFYFNEKMENGHIDGNAYINVVIDNDSLMLFLDTGNPSASIDLTPRTLERIDVKFTGISTKSYNYKGEEYISREYILPKAKIADLEVTNIHGKEHMMRGSSAGTFSFKFLENYNVLIDFPNSNMRLYKLEYLPTFLKKQAWEQVDAFIQGGFRMRLKLDGFKNDIIFTIDNAAIALDDIQKPYGLIRAKSLFGTYLKENNLIQPKEDDSSIDGIFSSDDFKLNGNTIPKMDFMVVDYKYPESDGLLGYHFFIKNPMFIDFKNKMIYVKIE
ncbi:hypothetical protein HQ585_16450 [candidate division KSB1 bacterium]|nr:hypothetical protein [candidate division KSB1 bacterium]